MLFVDDANWGPRPNVGLIILVMVILSVKNVPLLTIRVGVVLCYNKN